MYTFISLLAISTFFYTSIAAPITKQTRDTAQTTTTNTAALADNFPDPTFIEVDNQFYAFATSGNGFKVQIAQSASFTNPSWQLLGQDALPDSGSWSDGSDNVWAPYVTQLSSGQFVMYYSAPSNQNSALHCVGAATASTILGPYTPQAQPLACPLSQGGAIDPAAFSDPATGNQYLLYKIDGNSLDTAGSGDMPTPIMLQQVSPSDGITFIGSPVQLIDRDDSDGPLVEAPAMFFSQATSTYYLFFSSNYYDTSDYDLSYATASSITGPFTKSGTPLLATGDFGLNAPGSADVRPDGSAIVFHGTVAGDDSADPVRFFYGGNLSESGTTLTFTGFA